MAALTRSPMPTVMDDMGRWINPFRNDLTYEQLLELEKYQAKVQRELDKQHVQAMPESLF